MLIVNFFLTWLLVAVSLAITAYIVPGFAFDSFTTVAIASLILGLANAIIRPILVFFTLPLTLLTLGLFIFVINAFMLWVVGFITPGFVVAGFLPALLASVVLTFVSTILSFIVRNVT